MSLPALSPDEFRLAVRTWCEILDGEVSGNDLSSAYIRAARDCQDGFPLSAGDIVRGYRANCESERVAPRPLDSKMLTGEVCGKCYGSGLYVSDEKDAQGYKLPAVRCDHSEV